ncbi:MAG TPA: hypothetical protein VGU61_21990 [Noviherbaspirillum sp.]|jgi:hypothetical protein|uniref:hypothetical protein n=1 Tax=Noviherbaspirillum sp. TaxID=1926288 RepID=UPI002DDD3EBC|nr:hypothetical protein [Noviherbaspirillum sp.]HEV2612946.1 hypothetical protein [Noviherbaspirillum sp.]
MTQEEVLATFRQLASDVETELPGRNEVILELAQLLADSRGRLSKENFEALVRIGSALYKDGHTQFKGKSDVDTIMRRSSENQEGK